MEAGRNSKIFLSTGINFGKVMENWTRKVFCGLFLLQLRWCIFEDQVYRSWWSSAIQGKRYLIGAPSTNSLQKKRKKTVRFVGSIRHRWISISNPLWCGNTIRMPSIIFLHMAQDWFAWMPLAMFQRFLAELISWTNQKHGIFSKESKLLLIRMVSKWYRKFMTVMRKGPISSWQNMATVSTTFSFRHLLLTRLFVMTGVSFAVGARKLSGINIRRSIYSAAMMVFRFMMLWVYWTENRSMKLLSWYLPMVERYDTCLPKRIFLIISVRLFTVLSVRMMIIFFLQEQFSCLCRVFPKSGI